MEFLILGPVEGNVERFLGLVEVSNSDIVVTLGNHGFPEPVRIEKRWFYVRGKEDDLELLSKTSGIDIMSRIFRTKDGVTFSGISGFYNPSTEKFTRMEWQKLGKRLSRSKINSIFKEDVDNLIELFRKIGAERLDFLVISDNPAKPVFKRIIEVTRPKYLFYPSESYEKVKKGDTIYVGLEKIDSPKGKYILRF
jgi:hypothetical protein